MSFPTPPPPPPWAHRLLTVGVTGTNGKTSTTTWIAAALRCVKRPVARATTLGMFLDDIAVDQPLDYDGFLVLMDRALSRGGTLAAIELTSEALARGFVKSWPCRVGVFTNLTHDHLDAHGSFEHYLASKAQLFVQLPPDGTAVLNGCDESSELLAEVVPKGVRVLRYGVPSRGEAASPLDARAARVDVSFEGTRIALEVGGALPGAPKQLTTRAIGEIFAENALAAWLGAVAAGVPMDDAARAIAEAPAPAGRFEVVAGPGRKGGRPRSPHVVVDYAHTPDALARTLATARSLCRGQLVVVFGAGGNRDTEKREPMGRAARAADRVVLTNDNPRDEDPRDIATAIRVGLGDHEAVTIELDRERAIKGALARAGSGDVVVIAGKGHEATQSVGRRRRAFSDAEIARAALGQAGRGRQP